MNIRSIFLRILLIVGGLGAGVLLVASIVRLFPQILPFYLQDPLERRTPDVTLDIRITELDGDLYHASPGQVRPPDDPQVLAEFTASWDEDGFRIPAVEANEYPIIALGDSFTEGWLVEYPWPDVLARESGIPVRNLGFLGWSVQQEAAVMRDFGQGEHQWVLLAYFEGNDLSEIHQSYHFQRDNGNLLGMLERVRIDMFHPQVTLSEDGYYKYPLTLNIDGQEYGQGFHDFYIGRLNGPYELFASSKNVQIWREGIQEIAGLRGDACLGVIYIPEKTGLYISYAAQEDVDKVLAAAGYLELDEEGWLQVTPSPISYEDLSANFGSQRRAIREAAEEAGAYFIDLTPGFEEAIANGNMLHYTYDSHWNQAGHDLAGRLVADYLASTPECPG